jgi:flavodoxin
MKALIVYESMFGNTEQVARAIATGLTQAGDVDVELIDVERAPSRPEQDVELLAVGGPTHAFSMSRESTRADAIRQGATQGSRVTGLREWLEQLPKGDTSLRMVAFDTRVGKVRHLPGSAAKTATRAARRHGYHVDRPLSFYVDDINGPLLDGELERAVAWGRRLAARSAEHPEA